MLESAQVPVPRLRVRWNTPGACHTPMWSHHRNLESWERPSWGSQTKVTCTQSIQTGLDGTQASLTSKENGAGYTLGREFQSLLQLQFCKTIKTINFMTKPQYLNNN